MEQAEVAMALVGICDLGFRQCSADEDVAT
jgi:hypothetical protein